MSRECHHMLSILYLNIRQIVFSRFQVKPFTLEFHLHIG